jgi:microsomal epoxide hydrolase
VLREFTLAVSDAAVDDLERRLDATRWIDGLFADDWAYGTPLAFVQALCAHWRHAFDWPALEARINRQPNFMTEIEGLSLHFIHRRSQRVDAIPLILLHGWPSSILEFLDICDALADPPPGEPAFHVVIPSLPGYGFSKTRLGLTPSDVAPMMNDLMTRLGYDRFLVQGGNWGAFIGADMARLAPERIIGLHLNCLNGAPPPDRDSIALSDADEARLAAQKPPATYPHFVLYTQAPASMAHALMDSPAGLAGWLGHWLYIWADRDWTDNPGLSLDWMVATIAFYWLSGCIASSPMFYYEMVRSPFPDAFVKVPTAAFLPAHEQVRLPRPWAERYYNIVRWTELGRGGHYAAIELPDAFVGDLRGFAASLAGDSAARS